MPIHTRPDQVPLAAWQLACEGPTPQPNSPRRRLADLVVRQYSNERGVVADLYPLGGDIVRAAIDLGQAGIVTAGPDRDPGCPPGLACLAGDVNLAVVLPPDCALRNGRPFTPSCEAVEHFVGQAVALLRPGGSLVVGLVGSEDGVDSVGQAVKAATAAGLVYRQHVVALLTTALDGAATAGPRRVAHADVLVFSKERA